MLADQSATPEMRMKLFRFNPASGQLNAPSLPITLSKQVREGCFGDYLANSPDLEALTWDRVDDTTLITVTEDAYRRTLAFKDIEAPVILSRRAARRAPGERRISHG